MIRFQPPNCAKLWESNSLPQPEWGYKGGKFAYFSVPMTAMITARSVTAKSIVRRLNRHGRRSILKITASSINQIATTMANMIQREFIACCGAFFKIRVIP
jgi:hypothetical protein